MQFLILQKLYKTEGEKIYSNWPPRCHLCSLKILLERNYTDLLYLNFKGNLGSES